MAIEIEREIDGRILAAVPGLPGVMAYGATEAEALGNVTAIARRILADMVESGEELPAGLDGLLAD